jgi:hypothetical protein
MGTSNSTRAVFAGGDTGSNRTRIDYVAIATTGNSQDFGDLIVARRNGAAAGDSHGGIS